MPAELLPWTPLFLAACVRAFRGWRSARSGGAADAGALRAASWLALVFVLFSILPSKRALYLLPIYPAAALLLAREAAIAERAGALPRWVRAATAVPLLLAGSALLLAGVLPGAVARFAERDEAFQALELLGGSLVFVGAPLLIAGAVSLAPRLPPRAWIATVGAGFVAAGALYALAVVPRINPAKSARLVAEWVAARPEKPSAVACFGVRPEGYRFYAGIPAVAEPLVPALEREGARFLGLVDRKEWGRLDAADRARFTVLKERGVGGRDVLVLGAAAP
jgi:4-amino-4-deoxy-L-arabinose transferase-like glycosyltransferase